MIVRTRASVERFGVRIGRRIGRRATLASQLQLLERILGALCERVQSGRLRLGHPMGLRPGRER